MLDLLTPEMHQVTRVILHRLLALVVAVVVKLALRLLSGGINEGSEHDQAAAVDVQAHRADRLKAHA